MSQLTHGSLFSGIGGFDLGFERAGFKTVWQVEIDEYCRRVLERHFPDAARFGDVRGCCGLHSFTGIWGKCNKAHLSPVDVITGGFPCQDISNAGKRAGIEGEQSGLWSEYFRIICELRPQFVVVENVAALLVRGLNRVLGDLASIGYDAEWQRISAAAVGAPHLRRRLWIIAYPSVEQHESGSHANGRTCAAQLHSDPSGMRVEGEQLSGEGRSGMAHADRLCADVADASRELQHRSGAARQGRRDESANRSQIPYPIFEGLEGYECGVLALEEYRRSNSDPAGSGWWSVEPALGRVAHGIPNRVGQLKGLGNAVVPQIAEWIARRIKERMTGAEQC